MGGSGALFGMLGVLVVELLQGWRWVRKPWVELIKLIIMVIVVLSKFATLSPSPQTFLFLSAWYIQQHCYIAVYKWKTLRGVGTRGGTTYIICSLYQKLG